MNEFLNPVEINDTLNIRVPFEGRNIPVVISREAMEDHFDAAPGGSDELIKAYAKNSTVINARVLLRAMPGTPYNRVNPLVIHTADF